MTIICNKAAEVAEEAITAAEICTVSNSDTFEIGDNYNIID